MIKIHFSVFGNISHNFDATSTKLCISGSSTHISTSPHLHHGRPTAAFFRRSSSIDSLNCGGDDILRDIHMASGQVQSCIEWGMKQRTCCSGCVQFADRVGLNIDDLDHDALMAEALATRATKHTHRDKQCLQLWKKPSHSYSSHQGTQASCQTTA